MNMKSIHILLCSILLVQTCLAEDTEDSSESPCVENGVSPADESSETDTIFYAFAERLEIYTGLNKAQKYPVTLDGCDGRECVANPNGTAIWEARMELYMDNMMERNNETRQTTLDGCLCYSVDVTDFQNCMTEVRQNMVDQLETVLLTNFKSIVEADCSSVSQNCV